MTISSTTNRVTYTGNAVTDAFAVTYPFLLAADLKVYQDGTLKTITTHYTVTGGSGSTGTVTFLTAPASGDEIVILRDPAVTQGLDLVENDPLPAEELEKAFDKLTMIAQRNRDLLNRAMVLSDSATGTVSLTLPAPTALNLIGWNSDEDALVNYDSGSLIGAVAAVDWLTDIFDGDASQQDFTLTRDPGVASNCDVSISGVTQVPGVDYTVATTTISFVVAPPSGTGNVVVRYGSALPSGSSVPTDGVATASIQDGAVTVAKIADAELKALAGLASAANKVPMFSGSGTASLLDFKDEDNMASDSATAVPSQQSVKAYVDALPAQIFTDSYVSTGQTISSGGALTLAHGMAAAPKLVQVWLKCTSADLNYSINDEVLWTGGDVNTSSSVSITRDATNIGIRFGNGASVMYLTNKTTGATEAINLAKWEAYFHAYA